MYLKLIDKNMIEHKYNCKINNIIISNFRIQSWFNYLIVIYDLVVYYVFLNEDQFYRFINTTFNKIISNNSNVQTSSTLNPQNIIVSVVSFSFFLKIERYDEI